LELSGISLAQLYILEHRVGSNVKLVRIDNYSSARFRTDTIEAEKKRLYAALMENFAGYFAFTDHEVGRLLNAVKELPDADNTLIMYIVGDNGASAEGGPDGTLNEIKNLNGIPTDITDTLAKLGGPATEPHYPIGRAWAGNTPFQWTKQVASHLGGSRNPMVVSWPAKIKHDDNPRDAFLHVVDVLPTILESAQVPMPETVNGIEQKPLSGKSFLASFTDSKFKGRAEQYFEILSNRSIYVDGWKANAQHTRPWRQDLAPGNWENDEWELYNLDKDFSEADDLAQKMPGAAGKLPPGKHALALDFVCGGKKGEVGKGGKYTLSVDGKKAADGVIDATVPYLYSVDETLDVGEDRGTPILEDYADRMPFKFNGKIDEVTIELK
jgi:arylsulfatase A-like enzyme